MRFCLICLVLTGCVRGVLPENAPPGACHRQQVNAFVWQTVCDLSAWSSK